MKINIIEEKDSLGESWWRWTEICDKCNTEIFKNTNRSSNVPPDGNKADFCLDCLRTLMDSGITYEIAKDKYRFYNKLRGSDKDV